MSDSNELSQPINQIEQLLNDQPEQALELAEKLFNDHGKSAPVKVLYSRCLRMCKKLDEAKAILEPLVASDTNNIPAHMELALVLNNQQQYQEAIKLLTKVTEKAPEYHVVWKLLSEHLLQVGDFEAAKQTTEQYETIKAFNEQLDQANDDFDAGRYIEAEKSCRHLLGLVPSEFRALRLMAKISVHYQHFDVAASIYEYCLLQKPDDVELRTDFAENLLKSNQIAKSLSECEKIEKISKSNLKFAAIKAEVLVKSGHYQQALVCYKDLVDVHPRKDLCLLRKGAVQLILGDADDAIDSYQQALANNPELGEAYWNLANMKTYVFSDEQITQMKSILERSDLNNESLIYINFSLGKAYEDKALYEESFAYYEKANTMRFEQVSAEQTSEQGNLFDAAKQFFDTDYFQNNNESRGHQSTAPIFIVGLRRSGSTLLEQILASHSKIDGMNELSEISVIAAELSAAQNQGRTHYTESLAKMTDAEVTALGQRYLDYVAPLRQDGSYFIDKLPSNYKYIGLIKSILPNAKIIDIRRNPLACGWSLYKHFFAEGSTYSYDLAAIGKHFNSYVNLMQHWNSVLENDLHSVTYEDLINDMSATASSVLAYCELELEEACLEFHTNDRAVATISSEQVRQPIYKTGLSHWQNYEQFLEPLKSALE